MANPSPIPVPAVHSPEAAPALQIRSITYGHDYAGMDVVIAWEDQEGLWEATASLAFRGKPGLHLQHIARRRRLASGKIAKRVEMLMESRGIAERDLRGRTAEQEMASIIEWQTEVLGAARLQAVFAAMLAAYPVLGTTSAQERQ